MMNLILTLKSVFLVIAAGSFLLACRGGDPVAIIHLDESAERKFGNIEIPDQPYLEINNPNGGIIIDGTGDKGIINYMLYKLVRAEEQQIAKKNLDRIYLTHNQESDTLKLSIIAPESSQTLKYFCGLSVSALYSTNCYISEALGDISISDLYANLEITNAQDQIVISRHTGNCDISTKKGDIRVSVILPDSGYCSAETFEGDIDLYIPAQTSAQLTAETNKGSVYHFDVSFSQLTEGANKIDGIMGTGNGQIKLITGKGDVRIYGF